MRGNNTLELNEATLIEAMQEYLDKRMGQFAPLVKGVSVTGQGYEKTFNVSVSDKEKV